MSDPNGKGVSESGGDLADTATEPVVSELAGIVGRAHVLTEADVTAGYETDWTRRFSGKALAVVRPATVEEVSQVVRLCSARGAPVVPQGGNTGLVGGGVPRGDREQVVLSTARLCDVGEVDVVQREVTASAGVTLAQLQDHAAVEGFSLGLDLASRDSATVGGLVATNAGGVHAFKFGPVRDRLTGVEAVLGSGAIVSRLSATRKDNTGYHFPSLLAGSEGTLGVVTRARFRLVPAPRYQVAVLIGLKSVEDVVDAVRVLSMATDYVRSAELLLDNGLELVASTKGLSSPFNDSYPAYLLIEGAGSTDPSDDLMDLIEASPAADVAVGADSSTRARLWQLRDLHTECIAARASDRGTVAHKLDVAVPPGRVAEFIQAARAQVAARAPNVECYIFGHVGDGNLHLNLVGDLDDPDEVDAGILRLTVESGGSISAEHGIGIAKARWLRLSRTDQEIEAMRDIKRALDPQGILNPGVLLPPKL